MAASGNGQVASRLGRALGGSGPAVLAAAALPPLVAFWTFGIRLPPNGDASWYVLMNQRLLQGARYFYDVVETNPPVINMVMMPPALLVPGAGQAAYAAFIAYVCVLIGLSVMLCRPYLRALADTASLSSGLLTVGLSLSLTVGPGSEFGQREHLAIILTLPAILAYALPEAVRPRGGHAAPYLIAVTAAFGFALKPYFLAVPLIGAGFHLWEGRGWRVALTGPLLTFMGTGALIGAALVIFFTEYVTHVAPLAMMAYGDYRSPFLEAAAPIVQGFTIPAFALALLETASPGRVLRRTGRMLGLAAAGFGIAAFMQMKGWGYHLIPVVTLGCVAATILLAHIREKAKAGAIPAVSALVTAAAAAIVLHPQVAGTFRDVQKRPVSVYLDRPLARALGEAGQGGRVLVISSLVADGFPVSLLVGSDWGARIPHRWLVPAIARLREGDEADREKAAYLGELEISMLTEDLARFKPRAVAVQVGRDKDYVMEGFEFLPFYLQSDRFRREWADYEPAARFEGWEIYRRRD